MSGPKGTPAASRPPPPHPTSLPAFGAALTAPLLQVTVCPSCGSRNRLPDVHATHVACGTCKTVLQVLGRSPLVDATVADAPAPLVACPACGVRNRLPEGHKDRVRCGKCKTEMRIRRDTT